MMAFGARHLHWYWRQTSFHEDNMPYRVLSVRLTTILTPNGEQCLKGGGYARARRAITPADIDRLRGAVRVVRIAEGPIGTQGIRTTV